MRVLGIDPGGSGAFALYSPPVKARQGAPAVPACLDAWDMPVNEVTIGGKKRNRIDVLGIDALLDTICMLGEPDRIVIEQVGGMPGQASGFAFGYSVGALHAVLTMRRLSFEVVTPTKWKREVKAPKDKKEAMVRAEELFPQHRHLWRYTAKNGKAATRPDRAEAALLAYYGATVR